MEAEIDKEDLLFIQIFHRFSHFHQRYMIELVLIILRFSVHCFDDAGCLETRKLGSKV